MRILFIGTGEIGLPSLRALLDSNQWNLVGLVTQPDKPVGRTQQVRPPAPKRLLRDARPELPILQPRRIRDPEALAQIKALEPDVIVVMAYGQILPRALLEIPQLACLNLHASLLPRWRGAAPIQAAIAAGDSETGITVMYVDEGLDTGDVMLERKLTIAPGETGGSLHDRLADIAPPAMLEALALVGKGLAPRAKQDNAAATYAAKLTRESGRIDWTEPASVIERKIRAFDPWPGAVTRVTDQSGQARNLKVQLGRVTPGNGSPGQILRNGPDELIIAAGDRAVSLEQVQLEGKKRMAVAEFLRGTRVESVG